MRILIALIAILILPIGPADAEVALAPISFAKFCMRYPADCRFEASIDGIFDFETLQRENDFANASIEPIRKRRFAEWNIYPKTGDCNDYAVSKRHTLLELGWSSAQLLLAEVVIRETGEHHLLLIVRGARSWILDNLRDDILPVEDLPDMYDLVRVQTPDNPNFWQTTLP